jgi:hypothetical protein
MMAHRETIFLLAFTSPEKTIPFRSHLVMLDDSYGFSSLRYIFTPGATLLRMLTPSPNSVAKGHCKLSSTKAIQTIKALLSLK